MASVNIVVLSCLITGVLQQQNIPKYGLACPTDIAPSDCRRMPDRLSDTSALLFLSCCARRFRQHASAIRTFIR